ncbi:MAG TPA: type II toxin-antitoxin system prevent-host-death family antitoxin [Myxococcota bacterium]|nr:type II toxin-antitoxin system prevent-host-death family antitoxin [Myxococcota bacterium]
MATKSVNVTELKNRLSHYLRLVRRGQSILVRDRDRVIARIEPAADRDAAAGDDAQRLAALEERGILRRARGSFSREALTRRPRVKRDLLAALLREREETR